MENFTFMTLVDDANNRSKRTLNRKRLEYESENDRLSQFTKIGILEDRHPAEACFSLMSKHITSIADMVKAPDLYSGKLWHEKIGDLRNYTYLLEAILVDVGVM